MLIEHLLSFNSSFVGVVVGTGNRCLELDWSAMLFGLDMDRSNLWARVGQKTHGALTY